MVVAPRTYIKITCVIQKIGLHAQHMIPILGSIVIIVGGGGEVAIRALNEHENLHFDNEQDIHMRSTNYEKSNYDLNLNVLTIMY